MTTWHDMASESRKAANEMVKTRFRPCLSRAYYAAYSKVTHDLIAAGAPNDQGGAVDADSPLAAPPTKPRIEPQALTIGSGFASG